MAPAFFSLACPKCGKKLKVNAELAGKKVKCPGCGNPMAVSQGPSATHRLEVEKSLPPKNRGQVGQEDDVDAGRSHFAPSLIHCLIADTCAGVSGEPIRSPYSATPATGREHRASRACAQAPPRRDQSNHRAQPDWIKPCRAQPQRTPKTAACETRA
jgi:ribosomal protein S27E